MTTDSSEGQTDSFRSASDDELVGDLANDLRARVKSELEPGERLLWAARSVPPRACRMR